MTNSNSLLLRLPEQDAPKKRTAMILILMPQAD
jgi:hypothetical protein